MSKTANLIRTNLYISRRVWGGLKSRAFQERTTTSDLIDFLVRKYLKDRRVQGEVTLHRKHDETEDRKPRAVYFDPEVWTQLQARSNAETFSIASLVESLLVTYLEEKEEVGADVVPEERDPNRYVRVGSEVYDIGTNPIIISPPEDET